MLAPTGIAAINAGGSTLHSFFKLPFYPLLPDDPKFASAAKLKDFLKYPSSLRKIIQQVELIIIDEISMVRADIIDFIDRILRVYSRNFREPFGGKQLLLVGDVFQLEPVLKSDERDILSPSTPSVFLLSLCLSRDGTGEHRAAQGLPAERPGVCRRAQPHPHEHGRSARLAIAQHPCRFQ